MSRKHKIRWKESDEQELKKAVKNFNAKLDRIAKKNPQLKNALPERASVKMLKELINTRQDLKREINSLKRFNQKRGFDVDKDIVTYGDYNIKITRWQRNEINRRVAIINRRRKERLEAIEGTEVTSRGEKQGYTKGQVGMGKQEMLELKPMTGLTPGMNQDQVKNKYKKALIYSQSDFFTLKDIRCKANYITGLKNNFGIGTIDDLIKYIEEMPLDKFLEIFRSDPNASFEGQYYPKEDKKIEYANNLKATWMPNN